MLKLSKNAVGMLISKYRAVLKNMCHKEAAAMAACALMVFSPALADATDYYYPGPNGSGEFLDLKVDSPSWFHGQTNSSLYVVIEGTDISSGNNIYIDNSGGSYLEYVFGGGSSTETVADNTVTLIGGLVFNTIYGGYFNGDTNAVQNVSRNTVTVNSGMMGMSVYGGHIENGSGSVELNKVVINSSIIAGEVFGGYGAGGKVCGNIVTISSDSTTIVNSVTGGYGTGDVLDNEVTIKNSGNGTITIMSNVYGGVGDSNAEGNKVSVSSEGSGETIVLDAVYGGMGGKIAGNQVFITSKEAGTTRIHNVYGGMGNGEVSGNQIFITSEDAGTTVILGDVYGGMGAGNATDNIVTISGNSTVGESGTPMVNVFGASNVGNVENNIVTVHGKSTVGHNAYGDVIVTGAKSSGNGSATGNIITISGDSTIGDSADGAVDVAGGSSGNGHVKGNIVAISGDSTIGDSAGGAVDVVGGSSGSGIAIGNTVNISGNSTIGDNAYGAVDVTAGSSGNGSATDNIITISGNSTIGDSAYGAVDVAGGSSGNGSVTGNIVTISGNSTVGDSAGGAVNVVGGSSGSGIAIGNTVTISGNSTIGNSADGAVRVVGGSSVSGSATGNIVNITENCIVGKGSAGTFVVGGIVTGTGDAEKNTVNIADVAFIDGNIAGGSVLLGGVGNAANNTVNIGGGKIIGTVSGGYIETSATGGKSATGNMINITGGTVEGDIYGGYIAGGADGDTVTGNIVNITGGTVSGNVCGGFIDSGDGGTNSKITNNTIIISGQADLTNAKIYGGKTIDLSGTSLADTFTGNTLEVRDPQRVASIGNFEIYKFTLTNSLKDGDALLTTGSWDNTGGGAITVEVTDMASGGAALKVGDNIKLIDVVAESATFTAGGNIEPIDVVAEGAALKASDNIQFIDAVDGDIPDKQFSSDVVRVSKGIMLDYDFTMTKDADGLNATVTGGWTKPETKAFSEPRVAAMGFVNRGADLIAGEGIIDASLKAKDAQGRIGVFGAIGYGYTRFKSGSHADVDGISLMVGIASRNELGTSSFLKGLFFEGGWGNYDSYNSFSGADINSGGDVSYYGLGVLLRSDTASGTYVEGSLRGGKTKSNFKSNDFRLGGRQANVSYESSPSYFGAHLGVGRARTNAGGSTVDYYAKYFHTRQNGDDVVLSTGDPINFSSSDSNRLRGGVRFSSECMGGTMATYAGLAYEYEFSGEAKASTYGYEIDAPSVKGSTGILEIGLICKNSIKSANALYFGLEGYFGKRQGVRGNVQFKHAF